MKRLFLTFSLLGALLFQGATQNISKELASTAALNFINERAPQPLRYTLQSGLQVTDYNNTGTLFIVPLHPEGFVIVSGSQKAIPVVGYSFSGKYLNTGIPPQLAEYLNKLSIQIKMLQNGSIALHNFDKEWDHYLSKKGIVANNFKGRSIEPLLRTTWDQGKYYNGMCPSDPQGPGGRCYAGCVATAMGQVMNYFRWPLTGTGSYSYECPPYGTLTANFGETSYKWNEMPLYLNTCNDQTALLLHHLGISVDMVYGPNGSGMYNHKAAYSLRNYFKYSPETQYVYRDSTTLNWDSLLIIHLEQNIPMYYAGWSVPNINGHAFVCDGYQDPSYYHFNWGWSGSYDGYYYTDNLTPGGSNFNLAQEVIINALPDVTNYNYPYYCSGNDTLSAYSGTIDDGSGPIFNYSTPSDCQWLISPFDSVNYISIDFIDFNLSPGDTLYIFDGNNIAMPLLGKYSGPELPEPVISTKDEVYVRFVADSQESSSGWLLSYNGDIPVYCSGLAMFTEPYDTISDGSGPRNYHNETTCLWNIKPPNAASVTLYFINFNTELNNDVLKVYNGNQLIAELSGSELPQPITAESGSMFLTFSTNATETAPGWEACYMANYVGYNEEVTKTEAMVFPNPVQNKLIISTPDCLANCIVSIYTTTGYLLYQSDNYHITRSGHMEIDVSGLEKGVFVLVIASNEKSKTVKFAKTN